MYESDRLATGLWVSAHVRRCNQEGTPAYVVHKGAEYSGAVVLKLNQLSFGCQVLSQVRDIDGNLCWMTVHEGEVISESDADRYIRREIENDPDVWVVEVEDPKGHNPFEGKLLK